MNNIPKVYVDANVFKFSATTLRRLVPKNEKTRNWYGKVTGTLLCAIEYVNPNERITKKSLKREAELLAQVAECAKTKRLRLVMNYETDVEACGLPTMGNATGRFYGAPIEYIDSPMKHRRIISAPSLGLDYGWKNLQYNFLSKIEDKRFLQLQKATGAYQGKKKLNRNQLLDAFHLWCAEQSKCDYFLTLDLKLIKVMSRSKWAPKDLAIVTPSELLGRIGLCQRIC
jgi:hypothetical protein